MKIVFVILLTLFSTLAYSKSAMIGIRDQPILVSKVSLAKLDTSKNDFGQRSHFPLTGGLDPLYVVDSVIVAPEKIQEIDANAIESITVLKSTEALKPYGEKGRNGVVLITMKPKARAAVKD
ncbi:MAG TPA: hypothetical protein VK666_22625 [Chryseolinea sp.]|nr:hypothetical protein [Chryseolinea sp.]